MKCFYKFPFYKGILFTNSNYLQSFCKKIVIYAIFVKDTHDLLLTLPRSDIFISALFALIKGMKGFQADLMKSNWVWTEAKNSKNS